MKVRTVLVCALYSIKFGTSLPLYVQAMQNGWYFQQLLLWTLLKFGSEVQKIFKTQPFSLDQNLFCFIAFMNRIFRSAQISQLPRWLFWGSFTPLCVWIIKHFKCLLFNDNSVRKILVSSFILSKIRLLLIN